MQQSAVLVDTPGVARERHIVIPGGFATFSELLLKDARPQSIEIVVTPRATREEITLVFWGSEEGDSSEIQNAHAEELTGSPFKIHVPVRWVGDPLRPRTRWEPFDNFRLVTIPTSGNAHFTQFEYGLATQKGGDGRSRIFLTRQLQWSGNLSLVEGKRMYIPDRPEWAYPGAPGYPRLWSGIVQGLEEFISDQGLTLPLDHPAEMWAPPSAPPQQSGRSLALVQHYSPVAGHGIVTTLNAVNASLAGGTAPEDHDKLFCHVRTIKMGGPRALHPMTWIRYNAGVATRPDQKHDPIVSCTPA